MSAERTDLESVMPAVYIGAVVVLPDGRLSAQMRPDLDGIEAVMTAVQAANLFTQIALQKAAEMQSKVVRPRPVILRA